MHNVSSALETLPLDLLSHEHIEVVLTLQQHLFNMEFGLDTAMVIRDGTDRAFVLLYFIPLMMVGTLGNIWLICSVARILSKQWFPVNLLFRQISLYILTLSIVDLSVILSIPMLLSYILSGHWHFGTIGCKLFFAVENVNKLLSVMMLAAMSFERFIAVVRPLQWLGIRISRQKRVNNAFVLLICLLLTVALLCSPMIYYAQVQHYMFFYPDGSMALGDSICGSQLPDKLMSLFIVYMLLFGFIVPLPLIAVCYMFIIRHLRRKPHAGFISSYTARAVRSILRVVIFHFLCWTPFWLLVMLPLFSRLRLFQIDPLIDLEATRHLRMLTSFLPYLNSALNWVFYGMMNRQLRESSTLLTGRQTCMPLSSLPRSASVSLASKRRSTRSLIASSRL